MITHYPGYCQIKVNSVLVFIACPDGARWATPMLMMLSTLMMMMILTISVSTQSHPEKLVLTSQRQD